jgi:hypothetical protein
MTGQNLRRGSRNAREALELLAALEDARDTLCATGRLAGTATRPSTAASDRRLWCESLDLPWAIVEHVHAGFEVGALK